MKVAFAPLLIVFALAVSCKEYKNSKPSFPQASSADTGTKAKVENPPVESFAQQDLHFATLAYNLSADLVAKGVEKKDADSIAAKGITYRKLGDNLEKDVTNFLSGVLGALYNADLKLPKTDSTLAILGESMGHSTASLVKPYTITKNEMIAMMKDAVASAVTKIPSGQAETVSKTLLIEMMKAVGGEANPQVTNISKNP